MIFARKLERGLRCRDLLRDSPGIHLRWFGHYFVLVSGCATVKQETFAIAVVQSRAEPGQPCVSAIISLPCMSCCKCTKIPTKRFARRG